MDREAGLVNRLVEHTLSRHNVPSTPAQTNQLFSYAIRVLGSNLAPTTVSDEQAVLQGLKQEMESHGNSAGAIRLAECHSRLCSNPSLSRKARAGLLTLLRQVARDGPQRPVSALPSGLSLKPQATPQLVDAAAPGSGLLLLPHMRSGSAPNLSGSLGGSLTSSGIAGGPSLLSSYGVGGSILHGVGLQAASSAHPYSVSFPPSLENSFSAPQDGRSSEMGGPRGAAPRRAPLADDTNTFTVKEPLLVRDVLYAAQGIPGKFTVWKDGSAAGPSSEGKGGLGKKPAASGAVAPGGDVDGQGFVLVPEADVPDAERALVARLTELGWLFRKVKAHSVSAGSDGGAVRQAFCAALSSELADFYRLMAVLEAHAGTPIPMPGESEPPGSYLTLRRLVVWLAEPSRRMRVLALVADATRGMAGGALAGAVHAHAQHGDPFVSGYVRKVLHAVSVPLFDMIRRWVFEGVLEDPHAEFFVRAASWVGTSAAAARGELAGELATLALASALDAAAGPHPGPNSLPATAAASRDLWRAGYWLEPSLLPAFIGGGLAAKVLRAGKSINFLQDVCGDTRWVQEACGPTVAAAAHAASCGAVEALERLVDEASALVDRRLLQVLRGPRFQLGKHFDAIGRYLLLGQGDFVTALMDLVSKELDQDAGRVSEITLNHALRTALANSSACKVDDEEVTDRLRARKDRHAAGGEQGWDVFTLQYDVKGPLATVFTHTAMASYLRVFQLLWRLKRVEAALGGAWLVGRAEVERTLARLAKKNDGSAAAEEVVRRCMLLRSEMSHFATNLQYYLMFEVLEAARQEFVAQADAAADLDQLITAHEAYLATLLRKSLLDEASAPLRATLGRLTDNMLGLAGAMRRLSDVVQAADRKLADRQRRVDARKKGDWGTSGSGEDHADVWLHGELGAVRARVEELSRDHARELAAFTQQLPAQAHDEVRFLLYRLDFNDFARRRTAEDSMEL